MDISIISVSSMRIYRCSGSMYSTVPVRVTSSVLKEAMRKYLQNQEKHKVKKVAKKAEKSVPRGKQTVGKKVSSESGKAQSKESSKKSRKKCSSWKTDGWETDESEARSDQH